MQNYLSKARAEIIIEKLKKIYDALEDTWTYKMKLINEKKDLYVIQIYDENDEYMGTL